MIVARVDDSDPAAAGGLHQRPIPERGREPDAHHCEPDNFGVTPPVLIAGQAKMLA
jgi:hypothetical protein